MPIDDFGAVFLHGFSHFFSLDHSQVTCARRSTATRRTTTP
jgi:hypothetical protein